MDALPSYLPVVLAAIALGCGARGGLEVAGRAEQMDAGPRPDAASPGRDGSAADALSPDAFAPDARDPDCIDEPARCDDGDRCTLDDCLPNGACSNTPLRCDDGDACTDDSCDAALGCVARPTSCDDGDACTDDSCDSALGCLRVPVVCEDADPCTADSCDAVAGCVFEPTDCRGCADGSRDAFLDVARYPDIAACAGGFALPGLAHVFSPTCDRGAGDDGPNPDGRECSATDLCAPGWHVCVSATEVASVSVDGCGGASDAPPDVFFATRQTGPGCGHCATGTDPTCENDSCRSGCAQTVNTSNDIFGCGTLGGRPVASSCGVLDRFSNNQCSSLGPPWRCDDDPRGLHEADVVVKPGSARGGVLCCLD